MTTDLSRMTPAQAVWCHRTRRADQAKTSHYHHLHFKTTEGASSDARTED